MVNGLNSQEDSKKLEVTQNEINMEREKEAIDSIQSQSNELDKYLEGKSEPRFSFMKYLRRDKNRPSEDNEDAQASTSGSGPVLDNNGLPSYSEATMEDTLTAEDSATSSKMVDGARFPYTKTHMNMPIMLYRVNTVAATIYRYPTKPGLYPG